ncbi:hypothetical protein [Endozoicomonas sp. SCSIO W0465]|uniref:hypothetical protein n=1 Tax=Endozoicomonas sp. SCSIO W0465 TaxID=2918516 RepID=UPI002074D597|nr:hypothetical protein [Endozoicomonas sp. SCSIO W0465]USE37746.1 hypothetical protein MJO57_06000 [Endozoicomonas sp. SCSIO W0465]
MLNFKLYARALIEGKAGEDVAGFNTTAFSPDSQYFIACFHDAGDDDSDWPIYVKDFFIIVFSLDDNGQWTETIKITKHQRQPTNTVLLEATFSPDSRYLVVHGESGLDIWHLTNDNRHVTELKDHEGFHKEIINPFPESTVTFNPCSSAFVLLQEGYAMVWHLNDSGMWDCQYSFTYPYGRIGLRNEDNSTVHPIQKVSPDGKSIVCTDDRGRLDIRVQKQYGEWTRQTPGFQFCDLVFNQGGYLLAGLPVDDRSCLIVLGITPDGIWQEKGRLQAEGNIIRFNFSPSGHSIMVRSRDGGRKILSFWQIERQSDRQQAMNSPNSQNSVYAS